MGNSNGSIDEYWEAFENTHGLQGGFIWDWVDQVRAASCHTASPPHFGCSDAALRRVSVTRRPALV